MSDFASFPRLFSDNILLVYSSGFIVCQFYSRMSNLVLKENVKMCLSSHPSHVLYLCIHVSFWFLRRIRDLSLKCARTFNYWVMSIESQVHLFSLIYDPIKLVISVLGLLIKLSVHSMWVDYFNLFIGQCFL